MKKAPRILNVKISVIQGTTVSQDHLHLDSMHVAMPVSIVLEGVLYQKVYIMDFIVKLLVDHRELIDFGVVN